jgi:hypothetical protein
VVNRNGTSSDSLHDHAELVKGVAARVAAFHADLQESLHISATEVPNYYHAYPFLFRDEFPAVSEEQASTLAVAGVLYLNHLCLMDDLVDLPEIRQPHKLFLSALLHERAIIELGTLFPATSPFWAELSGYHREFAAAMLREQTAHTGKLTPFSEAEVFQIAKGKAALSKMTTTALALLARQPDTIANLAASQDCFNAARQLYDDVKDWKDDYHHRRYSSLLTEAILATASSDTLDRIDPEVLGVQLHGGGHIDRALAQAAQWCEQAQAHVAMYRVSGWVRLIQSLQTQIVRLRTDLVAIRQQAEVAAPRPAESVDALPIKAECV